MKKLRIFWNNLCRSTKWFIRMWNNYDWDDAFLIKTIVYKLKDMQYQLDVIDKSFVDLRHQPDRLHAPNDTDYNIIDMLAELDKAIEIGERILNNDYIKYPPELEEWHNEHGYFNYNIKMPENLKNIERLCFDKAEEQEQQDRKDFFNIIKEHHQKWWS